jgi:pimeloyl-ACP methyl ester carboxylesterase
MAAREWRESFAVAEDGTRLYVRERDALVAGSPLAESNVTSLLCDGIACDGFIWKYLWDFLAERTRVAHWHYRGHGRSASPEDPERIQVLDFAADVDCVRRHIGDPPVVLFGHSFGCQVALEGYRRRREKVRGLVLLCGSAGRVTHTFRGTDALAQILPGLIKRVRSSPLLARGLWGSVPPELSLKIAALTGEIDARLMDPRDLLPYLQHMADIDLLMFLRMLMNAGEHSAADLLPEIDVPALVIGGDRDNFTPVRYAEELAHAMPKGELLMLSATHVAPLEQRATVHERIGVFLDKIAVTPP